MFEDIWFPLILTLKISALSSIIVTFLGTIISYILARKNFRFKETIDALITLPMILPPTVTGYLLVLILGKNGYLGKYFFEFTGHSILFTWQAAVIAAFVVSLPLMVKTTTAAFEAVDQNLEFVSYTLGKNELDTALNITLPLAKKGILAGSILSFARAVGEFGATLMVAGNIPGQTNTMAISIYSAFQAGYNDLANQLVIVLILISLMAMAITTNLVNKWKM